jgi:hypothetical protein
MKSAVKETFIGALILMVVIFTLGILFYDAMPNNKTTPTSITYTAEASVTSAIQEISAENELASSSSSSSSLEDELLNIGAIIASYSLGSSELSSFAAKNTYESGKTDPFAEYVESTSSTSEGTTSTNTTSSSANNTNSVSGNTTNSSTGRLFENSTTK